MLSTGRIEFTTMARKMVRNPHFWVVVALSVILLLVYQAWPWRWWQFTEGIWRYFSWLSVLDQLVLDVELQIRVVGVLFFIPIVYGSLTLSWGGGLLAWLLSLIWLAPILGSWSGTWGLTNLLLLLLPVLLAAIVSAERRWRGNEKRYYAEREQERRAYIANLVDTQEAERRRIAQEIHDETLQTLLIVANKLDSLASADGDDERTAGLVWAKETLYQSTVDLRRLSLNLRPSILDNFGLVAGVRWLVDNNAHDGCSMTTRVKGEVHKMSSLAEVTVFRVVQEAVSNIRRHARAANASVFLEFSDDGLRLEIHDDGLGFDRHERPADHADRGKLGIIGMEQRILAIGGTMRLESNPGSGTRLEAIIPYTTSAEIV